MKPLQQAKDHRKTFFLSILPLLLALSLIPSFAVAESSAGDAQAPGNGQSSIALDAQASDAGVDNQAGVESPQVFTAGDLATAADGKTAGDIAVTVGIASESNVNKDLYVGLTYNDNFFAKSSDIYNDDLAYASTCLASAAVNSNEAGDNYGLKSRNVVSLLQQIGCKDVTVNDGYKYRPMEKANIGVAIGYKDITVNSERYRLFVFGVRGSGYEGEWAANMRVGATGDAQGFQEARDGILGFVMPYIRDHTGKEGDPTKVKIWASGYCRGGSATNLAFGWLNKWVYERNAGHTYNNLAYTQSYNEQHSVMGKLDSFDSNEMRYTQPITFSPSKQDGYLASTVEITGNDLYCYPVNCPFSADAADVANYEPLMTGIHNLINPDDWFPQVIMDWWGFKRYGYTHDHDITGTYPTDGSLHARDKSVWNPDDGTRSAAVNAMTSRLKAVDPNTAFNSTFFRQRYFSKASVVTNTVKKVGATIFNLVGKLIGTPKITVPDIFQISVDEKGEGNQFYSKGKELKYNQGAYYQEFMKFLLDAEGFPAEGGTAARKYYVDHYQNAFVPLIKWTLGAPLAAREKLPKVASSKVKGEFAKVFTGSIGGSPFQGLALVALGVGGPLLQYGFTAVWVANDSNATIPSNLINGTLKSTFDELGITYNSGELANASKVLGKMLYHFYDKEQGIAKFCFFHGLTMFKAGSSIAQSHWPEQSLAWFSQCKPSVPDKKPANDVKTQAEAARANASGNLTAQAGPTAQAEVTKHAVFSYYDEDPDVFYAQESRDNGEIVGVLDLPDALEEEGVCIRGWNLYSMDDFVDEKPALKTVTSDYVITASDPEFIVLTPIVEKLASKHVNLWLNKAMTGFDKDVLIGSFDVYDGGYWYIAYSSLPDGISDEGFDVLYYGDNKDLVNREGVSLEGWVNDAGSEENVAGFLPDSFVDYDALPAGDTVDLYGMWYDPVVYGITYHANRSSSDEYTVQDAEFSYDSNTVAIAGLDAGDEGMQNPNKTFVGWNTAADGSGEWFNTGDAASLERLGLGTRTQYVNDLAKLSELDVDDMPSYNSDVPNADVNSEADEFEAQLESKYTAHLYAQWKDDGTSPENAGTDTNAGTKAVAKAQQAKAPATGDTTMQVVLVIVVIALIAAVALIAAYAKRRSRN